MPGQKHKPAGSPAGSGGQFDRTGRAPRAVAIPKKTEASNEKRRWFARKQLDQPVVKVPPKPTPLVYFPNIDRSDDEEVSEWVAQMALDTGEGYHDIDRNPDAPVCVRYKPKDIRDKRGLKLEVDAAQDFWAKATALGLTDWCSKEDFVHHFWLDRDRSDWYTPTGDKSGFALCPDEETGQQLTEMAKQYPECYLYESSGGALYFSSVPDYHDATEILEAGGTLE